MTQFDDREKAYEAQFHLEQETAFRITVRRDKLLGLWAAGQFGLEGDEALAYAKGLINVELSAGSHDLAHQVFTDLAARGIAISEAAVAWQLVHWHEIAREQVLAELAGTRISA